MEYPIEKMPKYSKKELNLLFHMLADKGYPNLGNNFLTGQLFKRDDFHYYKELYSTPFENVPLYIHECTEDTSPTYPNGAAIMVRWRLKIGR